MRKALWGSWIGGGFMLLGLLYPICLVIGFIMFIFWAVNGNMAIVDAINSINEKKK